MARTHLFSLSLILSSSVALLSASPAGAVDAAQSAPQIQQKNFITVTRSDDANYVNGCALNLDGDGNLLSVKFQSETAPFSIADLKQGRVLNRVGKRNVMTLRAAADFDAQSGGKLHLVYLSRAGIVGKDEFQTYTMDVVKEGGTWIVRDRNHQDFNRLHLKVGKLGIQKVEPMTIGKAVSMLMSPSDVDAEAMSLGEKLLLSHDIDAPFRPDSYDQRSMLKKLEQPVSLPAGKSSVRSASGAF